MQFFPFFKSNDILLSILILAKLQSWKTFNNLPPTEPPPKPPKKEDILTDSWKASESWKLVRSAEKEMYRKMRKESKVIKGKEETSEYTEEKTHSNLEEKIEKLQTLPNVTSQGDIFFKHFKNSR